MADLSPHILLPWTILIYVCIEKFFSAINLEKESLYLVETFPLPEPDLVYNELNNWAHKLKKVTLKYIQYICFLKLFPFLPSKSILLHFQFRIPSSAKFFYLATYI